MFDNISNINWFQVSGMDYYGNDVGSVSNSTITSCQTSCANTQGCKGAVFTPGNNACYLKNKLINPQPHSDYVAITQLNTIAGVNYPGNDIQHQTMSSINDCQNWCVNTPSCTNAIYTQNTNTCWLKSALSNPNVDSNQVLITLTQPTSEQQTILQAQQAQQAQAQQALQNQDNQIAQQAQQAQVAAQTAAQGAAQTNQQLQQTTAQLQQAQAQATQIAQQTQQTVQQLAQKTAQQQQAQQTAQQQITQVATQTQQINNYVTQTQNQVQQIMQQVQVALQQAQDAALKAAQIH